MLDHNKDYRRLHRQLYDVCDKRLQALDKADYQGAELAYLGYDGDCAYTSVFGGTDDEIDGDLKATAEWLANHYWWGDVDELVKSAAEDAARAIDVTSEQLADAVHIRSIDIDGCDVPMIVIIAQPSDSDPTEYVVECDDCSLPLTGSVSSSDCLGALTNAQREHLINLGQRITGDNELTDEEIDEIAGYDYRVAICVCPIWDCGNTRVVPLSVADEW